MVFDNVKTPVFNLFYIMTEGVVFDAGMAVYRKVIFLLFIDVLQVLRVMCSYRYGWTNDTTQIVQSTDLVYLFTHLVSQLIPRYSFFIVAAVLVVVALLDSYYVIKLFSAGNVQTMWPVKLLRFLVGTMVTTLFSSVIKWLLIPLECLASKEVSFSSFVHDEAERCTPWGMPELIVSIPTIVLAAAYIAFALGTSYLAFEINPLSRHPRAMFTGRVETAFTASKVAVTLLVYLSELITPVAVAVIFFLFKYYVFMKHLTVLPFHSTVTNNVRGGIYGLVLWFSFATIIVAAIMTAYHDEWDREELPAWVQPLQYALVGFLPVAFLLGYLVTLFCQYRCGRTINRLRGDYERAGQKQNSNDKDLNNPPGESSASPQAANQSAAARVGVSRGAFEKFFDTEWESRRRFNHEWRAGVILRRLLYKRKRDDLSFMQFLVAKALEEHPESQLLQTQLLALNRFVFRDANEAAAIQKALKLNHKALPLDLQYILFAAERKSNQDMRGADLGQGAVSGISLMEFEVSIDKARKAHLNSVRKMREFWRHVKKRRSGGLDTTQAEELIHVLDEYEAEMTTAKREYELLIDKYPQSVQLLRAYAHFCDTLLNDGKLAETKQHQASLLDGEAEGRPEEEEEEEEEEEDEAEGGQGKTSFGGDKWGGASSTSEGESYRQQITKYLVSQREMIMGVEVKTVKTLHRRVQMALLMLLVLATAGYVLNDLYLFNGVALRNMKLIDTTGLFRTHALSASFFLRDLRIAAFDNNTDAAAAARDDVKDVMVQLRQQHWENYEDIPTAQLRDWYVKSRLTADVPVDNSWSRREFSYWNLANDFARRVKRAADTPLDEIQDPRFNIGDISEEKANIAYTYENTQTRIIPMFETTVGKYEDGVFEFGRLAWGLVAANVSLNALLVLVISFFVLRALVRDMGGMHSKFVLCSLALSLPHAAAASIYKYYDTVELNMTLVEDEAAERRAIITADDDASPLPSYRRTLDTSTDLDQNLKGGEDEDAPGGGIGHSQHTGRGAGEGAVWSKEEEWVVEKTGPKERRLFGVGEVSGLKSALKSKSDPLLEQYQDGPTPGGVQINADMDRQSRGAATQDMREQAITEEREEAQLVPLTTENIDQYRQIHRCQAEGEWAAAGGVGSVDEDEGSGVGVSSKHKHVIQTWLRDNQHSPSGTLPPHHQAEESGLPTTMAAAQGVQLTGRGPTTLVETIPGVVTSSSSPEGDEDDIEFLRIQSAHSNQHLVAMTPPVFGLHGGVSLDGELHGLQKTELPGPQGLTMDEIRPSLAKGSERERVTSGDDDDDGDEAEDAMLVGPSDLILVERGEEAITRTASLHCRWDDDEEEEEGEEGDQENSQDQPISGLEREGKETPADEARGDGGDGAEKSVVVLGAFGVGAEERQVWGRLAIQVLEKEKKGVKDSVKARLQQDREGIRRVQSGAGKGRAAAVDDSGSQGVLSPGKSIIRRMMFGQPSQRSGAVRSFGATREAAADRAGSTRAGSEVDGSGRGSNDFSEASGLSLSAVLKRRQAWHSRVEVYLFAITCVLAICVLSMVYPARNINYVVNMAPTTNQAGRRRTLMRACVHFTRELVLDDGFSRSNRTDSANALRWYLQELREADAAVRLGGDKSITTGADYHTKGHNEVMYDEGCPWREDATDCSTEGMPGREDVSKHGLQFLLASFYDAVETVLSRYAGPASEYNTHFRTHDDVATAEEFAVVKMRAERLELLESDRDVRFILTAFAGDVFNGLGMILTLFHRETAELLDSIHVETQLLFTVYVGVVALLFYWTLFRRTVRFALHEVDKARDFVMMLPTHVLRSDDVHHLVDFFLPSPTGTDDDDHDASDQLEGTRLPLPERRASLAHEGPPRTTAFQSTGSAGFQGAR